MSKGPKTHHILPNTQGGWGVKKVGKNVQVVTTRLKAMLLMLGGILAEIRVPN